MYDRLTKHLGEYAPSVDEVRSKYRGQKDPIEFVFYFDAPAGSEHHVLMWIPHLKKLKRAFIIMARNEMAAAKLHALGLPVMHASDQRELGVAVKLGAKVVFYANNSMRNLHMLRYNELTHVQLLHGESDKTSSFNPICAAYDIVAVAGPAGQARYATNDIYIPDRKFRIVSRPQLAELDVLTSANKAPQKTIFYATTWSGFHDENNHSSMPIAEDIIEKIVASGSRLIFRPHPYCYNDKAQSRQIKRIAARLKSLNASSGTDHCISNNPNFDMIYPGVNDCISASDVMISDVTAVLADWLYTTKPYITTDIQNAGEKFGVYNPLTTGGYVIDGSLNGFDDTLAKALSNDTLREARVTLRESVLGVRIDQNPETVFLEAMNDLFDNFDKLESQKTLILNDHGASLNVQP